MSAPACPSVFGRLRPAMDWLKENRAEDEELVAIVETDACGADAIQVLTGCTFGKGNFHYRDYGKQAFTLFGRKSGRGVRVCLRPGALEPTARHRQLMERIRGNEATREEQEEFGRLHQEKSPGNPGETPGRAFHPEGNLSRSFLPRPGSSPPNSARCAESRRWPQRSRSGTGKKSVGLVWGDKSISFAGSPRR